MISWFCPYKPLWSGVTNNKNFLCTDGELIKMWYQNQTFTTNVYRNTDLSSTLTKGMFKEKEI